MKTHAGITGLLLAGLVTTGCSRKPAAATAATVPKLPGLPVDVTVKQRTTTPVPGSDGGIQLTVDDITRGQVMVSLAGLECGVLLPQTSLEPDKTAAFKLGGENYTVKLKALNNALIGEDFATVTISQGTATLTESAKIERLLAHIGSMEGTTFIRNGSEHAPADAVSHLRTKWEAADDDGSMTAAAFVEQIASQSSTSDEPYRIRLADGTEVAAGDYLREQLKAQK
jgi:hypothetical protein